METSGRERRNRYFTIASYQALVAREKLDKNRAGGYADVDLSNVGGFFAFAKESFYTEHAALVKHQDRDAKLMRNPSNKPGKKKAPTKNPLLADGTVKKGRPRKELPEGEEFKPRKRKRKPEDGEDGPSEPKKPAKKRRLNAKKGKTRNEYFVFCIDILFRTCRRQCYTWPNCRRRSRFQRRARGSGSAKEKRASSEESSRCRCRW